MALKLIVLLSCLAVVLGAQSPSTTAAQDTRVDHKQDRLAVAETGQITVQVPKAAEEKPSAPAETPVTRPDRPELTKRQAPYKNHTLVVEFNRPLDEDTRDQVITSQQQVIAQQQQLIDNLQRTIASQQLILAEQQRMATEQATTISSLQNSVTQHIGAVAARDRELHHLHFYLQQQGQQGQQDSQRPSLATNAYSRRSSYQDAYLPRQQEELPASTRHQQ